MKCFIVSLLELDEQFDLCPVVVCAVADPNSVEHLPVAAGSLDREPRSCHKVDTFESYPRPQVMETDTFGGPAGDKRRQVTCVHVEHVTAIEGNTRSLHFHPHHAVLVDDPKRHQCMRSPEFATEELFVLGI